MHIKRRFEIPNLVASRMDCKPSGASVGISNRT